MNGGYADFRIDASAHQSWADRPKKGSDRPTHGSSEEPVSPNDWREYKKEKRKRLRQDRTAAAFCAVALRSSDFVISPLAREDFTVELGGQCAARALGSDRIAVPILVTAAERSPAPSSFAGRCPANVQAQEQPPAQPPIQGVISAGVCANALTDGRKKGHPEVPQPCTEACLVRPCHGRETIDDADVRLRRLPALPLPIALLGTCRSHWPAK